MIEYLLGRLFHFSVDFVAETALIPREELHHPLALTCTCGRLIRTALLNFNLSMFGVLGGADIYHTGDTSTTALMTMGAITFSVQRRGGDISTPMTIGANAVLQGNTSFSQLFLH